MKKAHDLFDKAAGEVTPVRHRITVEVLPAGGPTAAVVK